LTPGRLGGMLLDVHGVASAAEFWDNSWEPD
jgi:hypothetical protein